MNHCTSLISTVDCTVDKKLTFETKSAASNAALIANVFGMTWRHCANFATANCSRLLMLNEMLSSEVLVISNLPVGIIFQENGKSSFD